MYTSLSGLSSLYIGDTVLESKIQEIWSEDEVGIEDERWVGLISMRISQGYWIHHVKPV